MVVGRQPLTSVARMVAWLLAAVCFAGGAVGLVLAVLGRHVILGIAAAGICGLGVMYAGAAWRGRPWRWR
jgi:hypothetical protein